jgi:hypothetical protein
MIATSGDDVLIGGGTLRDSRSVSAHQGHD